MRAFEEHDAATTRGLGTETRSGVEPGHLEQAYSAFEASYALARDARTHLMMARTLMGLGLHARAFNELVIAEDEAQAESDAILATEVAAFRTSVGEGIAILQVQRVDGLSGERGTSITIGVVVLEPGRPHGVEAGPVRLKGASRRAAGAAEERELTLELTAVAGRVHELALEVVDGHLRFVVAAPPGDDSDFARALTALEGTPPRGVTKTPTNSPDPASHAAPDCCGVARAGGYMLSGAYGAGAPFAKLAEDDPAFWGMLFPVVGPFVTIGTLDAGGQGAGIAYALLTVDGVAQVAGLTMLIVGATTQRGGGGGSVLRLGPGGLSLSGRF